MKPIVAISDLQVRFRGERIVHALNGVDLSLEQGKCWVCSALVEEE